MKLSNHLLGTYILKIASTDGISSISKNLCVLRAIHMIIKYSEIPIIRHVNDSLGYVSVDYLKN